MKKHNDKLQDWAWVGRLTVGLDLSDKVSSWYAMDGAGEVREGTVKMTAGDLKEVFGDCLTKARIILESGTHANWVAATLNDLSHEPVIVDSRELAIRRTKRSNKSDRNDARRLMELGLDLDRKQVNVVRQRSREEQRSLSILRTRDGAVRARTTLINTVRGIVKPFGERVGKHSADSFSRFARKELTPGMAEVVEPVLKAIEALTEAIKSYDGNLEEVVKQMAGAERMRQVDGVGPATTAAVATTISDPKRFQRSRDVGPFFGLTPWQEQSGEYDPQNGISKAGDRLCRRMLVQAAQYILSKNGKDSALRRWGLRMAGDGKSRARKKRAVIAVARKLAVLMHRLWVSGEDYEPLRGVKEEVAATA